MYVFDLSKGHFPGSSESCLCSITFPLVFVCSNCEKPCIHVMCEEITWELLGWLPIVQFAWCVLVCHMFWFHSMLPTIISWNTFCYKLFGLHVFHPCLSRQVNRKCLSMCHRTFSCWASEVKVHIYFVVECLLSSEMQLFVPFVQHKNVSLSLHTFPIYLWLISM